MFYEDCPKTMILILYKLYIISPNPNVNLLWVGNVTTYVNLPIRDDDQIISPHNVRYRLFLKNPGETRVLNVTDISSWNSLVLY